MKTNGISLNSKMEENEDRKNDRSKSARSLFVGVVAGVALAAALGGAFMLGGRGGEGATRSAAAGQALGDAAVDDNADAASNDTGTSGNNSGGAVEPTVAPEDSADEPTAVPTHEPSATPTDEPTATPTATPEPGDPCPFCPEGLDDLQVEPTPVIFCPLCLDPELAGDLAPLEFVYTGASLCGGEAALGVATNRDAEIWVAYELDGATEYTDHTFGDGFYTTVDAVWGWFGGWGWFYPYHITAHAEDGDGNHIQQSIPGDYC